MVAVALAMTEDWRQVVWALRVPQPPQTFEPSRGDCNQKGHAGFRCRYRYERHGIDIIATCEINADIRMTLELLAARRRELVSAR